MPQPRRLLLVAGAPDDGLMLAELRRAGFDPFVLPVDNWVRRLELQIQRLPLAYIVVDGMMRVLEWNPAAETTFGYSKDEIVGREVTSLIFPQPLDHEVLEVIRRLRLGDMDANGVHVNCTKENRAVTCTWHNTPLIDDGGTFVGAVLLAQDVTEREALQERLRRSQRLEAIGELAAGVAHDFRGFATSINICTHLLGELLNPDIQVRQLLDEISKAAERSTSLTRQLLAFSREQLSAPRIVSLNQVIRDAEDMLRRLLAGSIRFTTVLDSRTEPVTADAAQIERVLFNLVMNAREAMPDGGTLTIETTSLAGDDLVSAGVGGAAPGRYTGLAITDSGAGMTEEVRQHIFEPFFTTKQTASASGLGLAVVQGIIKENGGYIRVESQAGQGTCFRIYLPCATERPAATSGE
ncbi:MAG TPA: ATP-binding protein [Pirellulales bacterium]|nr:ATP-binding protein [Pirellulales bacterium]